MIQSSSIGSSVTSDLLVNELEQLTLVLSVVSSDDTSASILSVEALFDTTSFSASKSDKLDVVEASTDTVFSTLESS